VRIRSGGVTIWVACVSNKTKTVTKIVEPLTSKCFPTAWGVKRTANR